MAFVNRVAEAAEIANHHPDILLHGWNKVRLTLSTHSQGGLTDADFELAARDRPLSALAETPAAPRVRPTVALATFDASTSAMNDDEDLPRSSIAPTGRLRARRPSVGAA